MYARELFSAGLSGDPLLQIALVLVIAGAPIVATGTLIWVRRNWHDLEGFRAAVVSSSVAALPGLALATDLVRRSLWARAFDVPGAPSCAWATTALSWGDWMFIGPCLFYWGIGERWLQTTPKGLNRVQSGHLLLWAVSSVLAYWLKYT